MGQVQEEEKKQKRDSLWPLREEASLVLFSSVSSQVPNRPVLLLLSLDGHENIFLNKLFYRPILSTSLYLKTKRTLPRMSGAKLLLVRVSQANLPVLTQAHWQGRGAGVAGITAPWMDGQGWSLPLPHLALHPVVTPNGLPAQFLQILTNAVIIKNQPKGEFTFPNASSSQ